MHISTVQTQPGLQKPLAPAPFLFTSCTGLDVQAPRTLKSKNLIHRNILIWDTENTFYPLQSSCCSSCHTLWQMVVLWIAFHGSSGAQHGRNAARVGHRRICPHHVWCHALPFCSKTRTWASFLYQNMRLNYPHPTCLGSESHRWTLIQHSILAQLLSKLLPEHKVLLVRSALGCHCCKTPWFGFWLRSLIK